MRTPRFSTSIAFALAPFLSVACANLPEIPSDTCGNHVIDSNEDCDTYAIGAAACGAPGTDNACRLLCTATTDCPAGWGCGTTGICREPSGVFTAAFDPITSDQTRLQIGDFDGDGRKDVLAGSIAQAEDARIFYFDDKAAIASTLTLQTPMRAPFVMRFLGENADARDDLLFITADVGVDAMLGQADRTMLPVSYPASFPGTKIAFFPTLGSPGKNQLPDADKGVAAIIGDGSIVAGGALVGAFDVGGVGPFPALKLPAAFGPKVRADIIDAAVDYVMLDSVCGDLVLLTSTEVDVIPLCRGNTTTGVFFNLATDPLGAGPTPLRVPLGFAAEAQSVRLGDVDGDGVKDIVVNTQGAGGGGGGGAAYYISIYGPSPIAPQKLVVGIEQAQGDAPVSTPVSDPILALGDFSGDGLVDIVTSGEVFASAGKDIATGTIAYVSTAKNTGDPWSQAIIADFNGDSFPDIAASAATSTDVEMFVGKGTPLLSAGTLTVDGVIPFLSSGDYDGDGITDLAIATEASSTSTSADILIAWGTTQGLPEAPVRVGSFDSVSELTSLHISAVDAVTVVGASTAAGSSVTNFAFLIGDANRVPLAPLRIPEPTTQSALAAIGGALEEAGRSDVVGFVGALNGATTNLVLAQGPEPTDATSEEGTLASFSANTPIPVTLTLPGAIGGYLGDTSVPIATGDVDGDGVLDVFVVDSTDPKSPVIRRVIAKNFSTPLTTIATAPTAFGIGGKLSLVDVDADGALDLAYVSGFSQVNPTGARGEQATPQGASSATIFWNDGAGNFPTTGVTLGALSLTDIDASTPAECTTFTNPIAVATLRVSAGTPALAVLTPQCLYAATILRDGSGTATPLLTTALHFGFSLVTGDLNGDGVDDVALLDDKSFFVLSQAPVHQ